MAESPEHNAHKKAGKSGRKDRKNHSRHQETEQKKRGGPLKRLLGEGGIQLILSRLLMFALKMRLPGAGFMERLIRNPYQKVAYHRPQKTPDSLNILPLIRSTRERGEALPELRSTFKEGNQEREEIYRAIVRAAGNRYISQVCLKASSLCEKAALVTANAEVAEKRADRPVYERIEQEFERIGQLAQHHRVRVYLDAADWSISSVMDKLALQIMEHFNQKEAIFHYTINMNRRDAMERISGILGTAKRKGFIPGIKLVESKDGQRDQERADMLGLPSPVLQKRGQTEKAALRAIETILLQPPQTILTLDTELQESCRYVMEHSNNDQSSILSTTVGFHHRYGADDSLANELTRRGHSVGRFFSSGKCRSVVNPFDQA